jgi:hypothetical protein
MALMFLAYSDGRFLDQQSATWVKVPASNDAPLHTPAFRTPTVKVASDQSPVLCLYPVKELYPDLSGQALVHLENVAPVNLGQLADGWPHHPYPPPLAPRGEVLLKLGQHQGVLEIAP